MRIVKVPLISLYKKECEDGRVDEAPVIVKKSASSTEVPEKVMTREEHQKKVKVLIEKAKAEGYEEVKGQVRP